MNSQKNITNPPITNILLTRSWIYNIQLRLENLHPIVFFLFRGKKERSVWYLVHWILGTVISLVGIINIYTGLNAYHQRTKRSSGLWTILFTAELSFIAVYYLFQDKRDYIQKQGVVSGDDLDQAIRQLDQELGDQSQRQNQKELLPQEPCGKHNALKNLFD